MNSWTIKKRIAVGFAVVLALVAIQSLVTLSLLSRERAANKLVATSTLPKVLIAERIASVTNANQLDALRAALATTLEERHGFVAKIAARKQENDASIEAFEKLIESPLDRSRLDEYRAARETYTGARTHFLQLLDDGKIADALAYRISTFGPSYQAVEEAAKQMADMNAKGIETSAGQLMSDSGTAAVFTATMAAVVFLGGSAIAFFLASGLNRILVRLTTTVSEASHQVSSASSQVSSASQSLAEGSSEQAASLEETSASLEEIASMNKRNADSAEGARAVAAETTVATETGTRQMQEMVDAMSAIKTSSDNIAKIIKTIDEIAFQTNILALNAAVEAARAGEAGAGFAVVADEVRALAQRAAQAAKETAEKIDDSIAKSNRGMEISTRVAEVLADITIKTRQVNDRVVEIATSSQEQTQGLAQIGSAVSQMDTATQANAGSAEETAAAAEELNGQAQSLLESVQELAKLVGGSEAARTAPAARLNHTPKFAAAVKTRTVNPPAPKAGPGKPSRLATPARNGSALAHANGSNGHEDFFEKS